MSVSNQGSSLEIGGKEPDDPQGGPSYNLLEIVSNVFKGKRLFRQFGKKGVHILIGDHEIPGPR